MGVQWLASRLKKFEFCSEDSKVTDLFEYSMFTVVDATGIGRQNNLNFSTKWHACSLLIAIWVAILTSNSRNIGLVAPYTYPHQMASQVSWSDSLSFFYGGTLKNKFVSPLRSEVLDQSGSSYWQLPTRIVAGHEGRTQKLELHIYIRWRNNLIVLVRKKSLIRCSH